MSAPRPRPSGPMRLLLRVVGSLLPKEDRDFVLADLEEAFLLRLGRSGAWAAHVWLGTQCARELQSSLTAALRTLELRPMSLHEIVQDVRFAVRSFTATPLFSAAAGLILATGICGSVVVFALVNGTLLRPLPYPDAEELVLLTRGTVPERPSIAFSYPDFVDVRERARSLEQVAAYQGWSFVVRGSQGGLRRQAGASVSWGYFGLLGVEPALGRFFGPDEGRPGHAAVVVVSHGFWTESLGGDPDLVGATLDLSGESYTLIGVTPPGFQDPVAASTEIGLAQPQAWRADPPGFDDVRQARSDLSVWSIARLRDDAGPAAASAELRRISEEIAVVHPEELGEARFGLVGLRAILVGDTRATLLALLAGVAVLLLITCVNVANLFLTRSMQRTGEMAVRTAMGASRYRLVRQLLVESLVFVVASGAIGFALAYLGVDLLDDRIRIWMPRSGELAVDLRVLGAALALVVATSVLFGLAPAILGLRNRPAEAFRSRNGENAGASHMRDLLAAGQVALAAILLVGSGLMVRSLLNLQSEELGLETDRIVAIEVSLPAGDFPSRDERDLAVAALEKRARRLPGVSAAGTINALPMSGRIDSTPVVRAEALEPVEAADLPRFPVRAITPAYPATVGMALVRGRSLLESDRAGDAPVALINQAMAAHLFSGEDPVGQRIWVRGTELEVVGVVRDVRQFGPARAPEPEVYTPYVQETQDWMRSVVALTLRQEPGSTLSAGEIRAAIAEVAPDAWTGDVTTLRELLDGYLAEPRFRMALTTLFGLLALLLASAGVAAVMGYAVARRTKEFAVRLACGAAGGDLVRAVIAGSLGRAGLGLALGLVVAAGLSPFLEPFLHEIGPRDPAVFAATGLTLGLLASVASLWPAGRAARIRPGDLLRGE